MLRFASSGVNLERRAPKQRLEVCISAQLYQLGADVVSREVISYLNPSGSRQSSRPSAVSACGYMKNPTGAPFEPGKATSWAKLNAIQFISQDPNNRVRAFFTISSSSGRFPGGSSSTTFRTSAGSTGIQP